MTSKKALVLVGTIVLLVVAVVAFWLGQKDTIKITSGDRAIAGITEKMMRNEPVTPAEQKTYQDMQNEAANKASKFFGLPTATAPTATPVAPAAVPAGFRTGNWVQTLETKYGPVRVMVSNFTGGKVAVRTEMQGKSPNYYLKNNSSSPITVAVTFTWQRSSDHFTVDRIKVVRELAPNEVYDEGDKDKRVADELDIRLELR